MGMCWQVVAVVAFMAPTATPFRSPLSLMRSVGVREGAVRMAASMPRESDVVVIGSGIGGLSAAGILSSYGYDVLVLEAHTAAGGAAHGFKAKAKDVPGVFHFDSGPSFFSGISGPVGLTTSNPLKTVLNALGESVDCHVYNSFGLCFPEVTSLLPTLVLSLSADPDPTCNPWPIVLIFSG